MTNIHASYGFDKGPLTPGDLHFFEDMAGNERAEASDHMTLDYHKGLSENRRLIIRQLLAEVSRHRSDYTWEW